MRIKKTINKNQTNKNTETKNLKKNYYYYYYYSEPSISLITPNTVDSGNQIKETVKIRDENGIDGRITLYVDGKYSTSKEVYSYYYITGTYYFNTGKTSAGTHKIRAEYYSYNNYNTVTSTKNVNVKAPIISISLTTPSSISYGDTLSETVKIRDENEVDGRITLYVDGEEQFSEYVGSYYTTGTYNFKTTKLSLGSHTIRVEYYSYNTYKSVNKITEVYVKNDKKVKSVTFTNFRNDGIYSSKMINEYDTLWVGYTKGYSGQYMANNVVVCELMDPVHAKITKGIVYYKQNGKNYSKTMNTIYEFGSRCTYLKNGQTPYKITVYYIPYYYT